MVESSNSNESSGTPTYASERFKKPTWSVLVNAVEITDAILERVELGFGNDLSTAVFTLARTLTATGLPVKNDNVQIIVNGRSIFRGKIKIISKHVGRDGLRVSYVAHSNIINHNRDVVLSGAFNSSSSDFPGLLFTVKGIFNKIGMAVEGTPNIYPGTVNITDQTKLNAVESVLGKIGNYKLYYDMETDKLIVYALNSGGINQRSFIIGKNILTRDINTSTENVVNRIIVVGPPTKIRRQVAINNTVIRSDASGRRAVSFRLVGQNISDIVVEGLTREQPKMEFYPGRSISKSMLVSPFNPIELPVFTFGTDETEEKDDELLQNVILSQERYTAEWTTLGVSIEERSSNQKTIFLNEVPKMWFSLQTSGKVPNRLLGIGAPSNPEALSNVSLFDGYEYTVGSIRVSYTVETSKPVVTVGSGSVTRSITDSQYQIVVDNISGVSNQAAVISQMSIRAAAELAKLNVPDVSGTIRIIGDETVDLRQAILFEGDTLDILHVTHSFTNGFTTDVTLTNENLRVNAIGLPTRPSGGRRNTSDSENDRRRTLSIRSLAFNTAEQKLKPAKNEKKDPEKAKLEFPNAVYKK